jgi:HK97 gp10 family phage protein
MSVSVSLDVLGGEEFAAAVSSFDSAMQRHIQEQLSKWAEIVKTDAERRVPIRTGYLQSTIYAKTLGWQIEVGAEAEYAAAVEFGTAYTRAQPYLNPAVQAYLPTLERVLLEALNQAKKEAQL